MFNYAQRRLVVARERARYYRRHLRPEERRARVRGIQKARVELPKPGEEVEPRDLPSHGEADTVAIVDVPVRRYQVQHDAEVREATDDFRSPHERPSAQPPDAAH